ncbi:MAG: tetratricopeptide repeat protein, partial [Ardenticatenaceae bacterium]
MSNEHLNTINELLNSYEWSSEPTVSRETRGQYEQGLDLVHAYRGRPDQLVEAVELFQAIPSRPYACAGVAYTLLAASYLYGTEYDAQGVKQAERWLVHAQSFAPNQPEINFIGAIVHVLQTRYDQARYLLNALALPTPNYYVCLAEMRFWEHQSNIHQVYYWYQQAAQVAKREEQRLYVINIMAGNLLEAGLPQQAAEMYEHLAQYTFDDPWVWHNFSIANYRQGEYKKAWESNQRALKLIDFEAARDMERRLKELVSTEIGNQESSEAYQVIKTYYGGMGIVQLCYDPERDAAVALKTLRPEFLPTSDARNRFLRAGTAWVNLGIHPHVVPAYRAFSNSEGEVFIVLKWLPAMPGKSESSLRAWLEPDRPLPLAQALTFGLHIVRGMQHATKIIPGLVHGDLKPANVFIGYDEQARVADFGLATLATNDHASSQELGFASTRFQISQDGVGTPRYMAPEQWRDEPLDLRTDIYAFGCMVHEMVTGQPAATGDSLGEVAQAHRSGRLSPLPAKLPEIVQTIISRACATAREARYPDWNTLEIALKLAYREVTGNEPPSLPVEEQRAINLLDLGWSYNALGLGYADTDKHDMALTYLQRAHELGLSERRRNILAPDSPSYKRAEWLENTALTNMGMSYREQGLLEQAEKTLEQALDVAEKTNNSIENARVVGNLGLIYLEEDNLQKAQLFLMRDLATTRKVGSLTNLATTLRNLGTVERRMGNLPRARERFEEGLEVIRQTEDRHTLLSIVGNLAVIDRQLGDLSQAAEFSREQLELAQALKDRRAESQATGNLAHVRRDQGDIEQAIPLYEQRIALSTELDESLALGQSHVNLMQIYMQQENWAKAIPSAKAAIEQFEKLADSDAVQEISLALVSNRQKRAAQAVSQKQYAVARRQLELGLDGLRQFGEANDELDTLNRLSNACRLQKEFAAANDYAQQALQLAKKLNHSGGEVQAEAHQAHIKYDQGNREEALKEYVYLIALARREKNWRLVSDMSLAVAEIFSEEDKWVDAEAYAVDALEMRARVAGQEGADEIRPQVQKIQEEA